MVMSLGAAASSAAKPEPMRSKTPPKNLPAPRLTEAALNELKGSVGKVIQPKPRTPSPKRAVEGMARNDAAAGRLVPEVPKAASEPKTALEPKASPEGKASSGVIASENVTSADDGPKLLAAAGGRLSGVTAHGLPVASQAPTPMSPARDAGLEVPTSPMPGATPAHWSQAPVVSAPGAAAAPSTPWSQVPVVYLG